MQYYERELPSMQVRNYIPDIPAGRSVPWPFVLFFALVLNVQTEQTNQKNQNPTSTEAPRERIYAGMQQSPLSRWRIEVFVDLLFHWQAEGERTKAAAASLALVKIHDHFSAAPAVW